MQDAYFLNWLSIVAMIDCYFVQTARDLSPNRSISPLRDRDYGVRDYGVGRSVELPSASRNQRYRQFLRRIMFYNSCYWLKLTSYISSVVICWAWGWTCHFLFPLVQVRYASLSSLIIEAACRHLLTRHTQGEQLTTVTAATPSMLQSQAITSIHGQIFHN